MKRKTATEHNTDSVKSPDTVFTIISRTSLSTFCNDLNYFLN